MSRKQHLGYSARYLRSDEILTVVPFAFLAASFEKYKWGYVVIDEGHKIKNSQSSLAANVRALDAEHRLLLTGTPIQNNMKEIWALLDFLFPSKKCIGKASASAAVQIPEEKEFLGLFTTADRQTQEQAAGHLSSLLKTIVLRRNKKEAAPELKDPHELLVTVEMAPAQVEAMLVVRLHQHGVKVEKANSASIKNTWLAIRDGMYIMPILPRWRFGANALRSAALPSASPQSVTIPDCVEQNLCLNQRNSLRSTYMKAASSVFFLTCSPSTRVWVGGLSSSPTPSTCSLLLKDYAPCGAIRTKGMMALRCYTERAMSMARTQTRRPRSLLNLIELPRVLPPRRLPQLLFPTQSSDSRQIQAS
jgi:hypothetical protein